MDLYVKKDFWGNCAHVMLRRGTEEWIVASEPTESLARQSAVRLTKVYSSAFGVTVEVAA